MRFNVTCNRPRNTIQPRPLCGYDPAAAVKDLSPIQFRSERAWPWWTFYPRNNRTFWGVWLAYFTGIIVYNETKYSLSYITQCHAFTVADCPAWFYFFLRRQQLKPRLHQIHVAVAGYKYHGRATCIRLQVDTMSTCTLSSPVSVKAVRLKVYGLWREEFKENVSFEFRVEKSRSDGQWQW